MAITQSNQTNDNTNSYTTKDTNFTLQDDGDTTKQAQFQLSGITTGTTRTYALPDASGTLMLSGGSTGINYELIEDWTDNTDINPPTTLETGQALVSSYVTNSASQLQVVSNKLTNSYATGTTAVAGYLTANMAAPVLYIEGKFQFRTGNSSADGITMAMPLWESALPSGSLGATTNRSPCHPIFTPTYYAYQTYDSGGGGAATVGNIIAYTIPVATPKSFAIALDPANNRAVMLGPDGVIREFVDTMNSRISSVTANYSCQEILRTTPNADKWGDWLYWHASTLVGEEEQLFLSKWRLLLMLADSKTPRVFGTTSSATPAINVDSTDEYVIIAQATAITSMTSGLTGTPQDGQSLIIRIKDNGTARAITWGSSFQSSDSSTLITTTVIGKTHILGFKYDSVVAKFVCITVNSY